MKTAEPAARRRTVFGNSHLTMSNSPDLLVPAAHFCARGLQLRFTHPESRGGRSAEKRSGAAAPVGHAITRHVRRLRGALRPMTRQYVGRNNVTIPMPDGRSVPIVSQTEIEPMKTALFLIVRSSRRRRSRALPAAKPQSPGGAIRPRNWSNRAKEAGTRALIDGTLLAGKVAM